MHNNTKAVRLFGVRDGAGEGKEALLFAQRLLGTYVYSPSLALGCWLHIKELAALLVCCGKEECST